MSTATKKAVDERLYEVGELTRVEGEGSLRLRVRDGEVVEARLGIFETPRYFEQLVVGRTPDEVIDMVARICGICPVAYQMSAVARVRGPLRDPDRPVVAGPATPLLLRRVDREPRPPHLPPARPRLPGLPRAPSTMAADHRPLVEQALRMKKAGNRARRDPGRAPDPPGQRPRRRLEQGTPRRGAPASIGPPSPTASPSPRRPCKIVGGFDDAGVRPRAAAGQPSARRRVPVQRRPHRLVRRDRRRRRRRGGTPSRSTRSRARTRSTPRPRDGKGAYLLGPAARVTLAAEQLHPLATEALVASGFEELIRTNMYASIVARAVELVHAFAEAIDIIDAYRPPSEPLVAWQSRPGVAAWATEAPRGLLFHRYEVDEAGRIKPAQIVPPTSQNQAAIEADLVVAAKEVLELPHDAATQRLEQMIRRYDPCISCATHFLDLTIEEA